MGFAGFLGGAGAGLIGAGLDFAQQAWAQAFAKAQQRRAFEFAERMRETSYQTAVGDLREAGLNPVLAAGLGPTPTPSAPAPTAPVGTGVGARAITSAKQGYFAAAEKKILDQRLRQAEHEANIAGNQERASQLLEFEKMENIKHTVSDRGLVEAHTARVDIESQVKQWENLLREYETVSAQQSAEFFKTWYGKLIRKFGTALKELSPVIPRSGVGVGVSRSRSDVTSRKGRPAR